MPSPTDGRSHIAKTVAFTCHGCDSGMHWRCREKSSFASPWGQVCTCACLTAKGNQFELMEVVLNRSGRGIGSKTADGRIFGFGPMGVPA